MASSLTPPPNIYNPTGLSMYYNNLNILLYKQTKMTGLFTTVNNILSFKKLEQASKIKDLF